MYIHIYLIDIYLYFVYITYTYMYINTLIRWIVIKKPIYHQRVCACAGAREDQLQVCVFAGATEDVQ